MIDNYILTDKPEVIAEKTLQPAVEVIEKTSETVAEATKAVLQNSVAVLPFENLSPNPDDAYLAIGIHQETLDYLAKIQNINLISRPSVFRYEGTVKTIAEIASELNVETILKGSVHYAYNRITIDVWLFDDSGNNQLWSEEYERDPSDIFAIQAEIIEHIALALSVDMSAAEQERIEKVPTHSVEAYALYLKARALTSNIRPGAPLEFFQYLDQAIALDPNFAPAHAVKASGYGVTRKVGRQLNGLTVDEVERVALKHAEIALALDPNMSFAYLALGFIHQSHWRTTEGRLAFERAIQLSPNDVEILDEYAIFLSTIGAHDEAIQVLQRVLMLSPYDVNRHILLGGMLTYVGNPIAAADSFRKAIEIMPSRATSHAWLGFIGISLGNETEAQKEIRLAEQLLADNITTRDMAQLSYAYSRLGLQEEAIRLVKQLEIRVADGQFMRKADRVLSYLVLGEIEKAYDLLSQNLNEGSQSIQYIKFNIMNDPVLEESRFVELRNKILSSD